MASVAMATLLSHRKNLGKGAAVLTAFNRARRNGHELTVLLDGDGQHDSDDIPALMRPGLDGEADIVLGDDGGSPTARRYATGPDREF